MSAMASNNRAWPPPGRNPTPPSGGMIQRAGHRVGSALATTLGFLVILWGVQMCNALSGYRLVAFGVQPRELNGLAGIAFAPFIHASWTHLIANSTISVVVLFLLALSGQKVVWVASIIICLFAGMGTWLTGQPNSVHVGASGLIFGWLTFLMLRGWFSHSVLQVVLGVVVFLLYGGVMWGILPTDPAISWQGHLFGAVGGVVAARNVGQGRRAARAELS